MGLLSEGHALNWSETKPYAEYIRVHGIEQFINSWNRLKHRRGDSLKWGDEIEGMLVRFDHANRRVQLLLRGVELLELLKASEVPSQEDPYYSHWVCEYGEYMVEGTPGRPYGGLLAHFNVVEKNMGIRRNEVNKLLNSDTEAFVLLTTFPRLGCPSFTFPSYQADPLNSASHSLFFPDEAICQGHPRFRTLTKNIRERRGSKIRIQVPIFRDVRTPDPFLDPGLAPDDPLTRPDHIYMDAMGFGMGSSCAQVTFQASSLQEAVLLYDQLAPLCPILLALTAASPVWKGFLSDCDCRWNVISAAVDCRTPQELGLEPLTTDKFVIPKSRYDSIDCYLSAEGEPYNDIPVVMDRGYYERLVSAGVAPQIARHVAHLFIRDPMVVYREKLELDDAKDTDHFENIQSTNWQTMRFKPPPAGSPIGWRVEFRPLELQLTDFENAAYVVFVVLLTRVILTLNLDFLMPISQVDANMQECQKRDAVGRSRFHFRTRVIPRSNSCSAGLPPSGRTGGIADDSVAGNVNQTGNLTGNDNQTGNQTVNDNQTGTTSDTPPIGSTRPMTLDEIVNGSPTGFIGLIPLVYSYVESHPDMDVDTRCTIGQYLKLIGHRASGKLRTTAGWIRSFVTSHPEYRRDSVVPDGVCYDLLRTMTRLQSGEIEAPDLLFARIDRSQAHIPDALRSHLARTGDDTN